MRMPSGVQRYFNAHFGPSAASSAAEDRLLAETLARSKAEWKIAETRQRLADQAGEAAAATVALSPDAELRRAMAAGMLTGIGRSSGSSSSSSGAVGGGGSFEHMSGSGKSLPQVEGWDAVGGETPPSLTTTDPVDLFQRRMSPPPPLPPLPPPPPTAEELHERELEAAIAASLEQQRRDTEAAIDSAASGGGSGEGEEEDELARAIAESIEQERRDAEERNRMAVLAGAVDDQGGTTATVELTEGLFGLLLCQGGDNIEHLRRITGCNVMLRRDQGVVEISNRDPVAVVLAKQVHVFLFCFFVSLRAS
jgi:hypothetical protein